jgi:hypothetical protein
LLLLSPFALLLVAVSAGLGAPKAAGLPLAAAAVGMAFVGALLGWSAVLPLTRLVREVGEHHGLDASQRFGLINGFFYRDVLGLRMKAGNGSE